MIEILHRLCRACDACVAVCPTLALWMEGPRLTWDPAKCRDDHSCVVLCPAGALKITAASSAREQRTPPAGR